MSPRLLDTLRAFNSKERFFLLSYVLGNSHFTLSEQFRSALRGVLAAKIPEGAFCAVGFHLEWLYAALQLAADDGTQGVYSSDNGVIKAQQEDTDLLVAFGAADGCHIVLVEAKATTGWSNGQMKSKAARMADIFGNDGRKWAGVTPHFVLTSPRPPQQLTTSDWPQWMAPQKKWLWMPLDIPKNLKRVSRCESDGTPRAHGEFWTVLER